MTATTTELQQDLTTMVDLVPFEEPTIGEKYFAHIVNPPRNPHIWAEGMSSQEMVDIARMTGQHLVALCGFVWVPKLNPDKFPICDACMTIAGQLMGQDGE